MQPACVNAARAPSNAVTEKCPREAVGPQFGDEFLQGRLRTQHKSYEIIGLPGGTAEGDVPT